MTTESPSPATRPWLRSIRGKVVSRTLLVSLLPLGLVGGFVVTSLRSQSGQVDTRVAEARQVLASDVAGRNLQDDAQTIAQRLDDYLRERIEDIRDIADSPSIRGAAAQASASAQSQDLASRSADDSDAPNTPS